MLVIDNELTKFIKLINLMLPEHGDIALLDDEVELRGVTRFIAGEKEETYRLIYSSKTVWG